MPRYFQRFITMALSCVIAMPTAYPQSGAQDGEWRTYGGDLGHTRYAPLSQINASNFSNLEVAWRFKTDSLGPRPEFKLEGTPLMAGGGVYATGGTGGAGGGPHPPTREKRGGDTQKEGGRGGAAGGPR